jgi:hypothetical protein
VKHPVLATFVAAGTLAAIVAAYQRGARVYQEMVDKGEIDPLNSRWTVHTNHVGDRPVTNLSLPATPLGATSHLYRIPADEVEISIPAQFGTVRLVSAKSYFRGTGIFVYFPAGIRFGKKTTHDVLELIATRLFEDTDGEFHFTQSPGSSNCGDDDIATALITAGTDHHAYLRYHGRMANELDANGRKKHLEYKGYFKFSDAPKIRAMASRLSQIFDSLDRDDIEELMEAQRNAG